MRNKLSARERERIPYTTFIVTRFVCVAYVAFRTFCPIDVATPDERIKKQHEL